MTTKTFLVEIGTEELPPKILRNLAESFSYYVTIGLNKARLSYGKINWYATPRRLALKIYNLNILQPDLEVKKRGPTIDIAFDKEDMPTKVAKKWANCCGIKIDQIKQLETDKDKRLIYHTCISGKKIQSLLPDLIIKALKMLPISRLMRWGDGNVQFIRPVHTVTLLLGNELVPGTVLGIESSRTLLGHRFMGEQSITIEDADQYPEILEIQGKVIADYEIRKEKIKSGIKVAENQIGGNTDLSNDLLEEVTSLVEWPVVLIATFEEEFLELPAEILSYIMKRNQKYFPIYSKEGKLLPYFIFVSNVESMEQKYIISGNEKVIRSRLSDAKFFFYIDRKRRLEDNLQSLETMFSPYQLGTIREKTDRIQVLAEWVAEKIGADVKLATRAGLLSKCDLTTNMVFEFTNIQGVIGMYYARQDGEEETVAIALNEQYQPRFSRDKLPSNLVSCALAISDKIDTLTGIFGVGQYPKGDRDPFALRRAALGILRIIVEKHLLIDLKPLIELSVYLYGNKLTNLRVVDEIIDFMLSRFLSWYKEKGYSTDIIRAVLARRPTYPIDFDMRVKSISHFCNLDEAAVLITINKRISNILEKSIDPLNEKIKNSLLKESEEIKLAALIITIETKLQSFFAARCYYNSLVELSKICKVVDTFFEKVIVNVEEKEVRINRLSLLAKLHKLFLQVADMSLIQLR